MALTMGGQFFVQSTPEETYDFLTDPQRFYPFFPDCEELRVRDAEHFTLRARVRLPQVRSLATVRVQLTEAERPTRAFYRGKGSVARGALALSAGFELRPSGAGTRVSWKAEAQVPGRLISIAGDLLAPLAGENAEAAIDRLQQALGVPRPQPAPEPGRLPDN